MKVEDEEIVEEVELMDKTEQVEVNDETKEQEEEEEIVDASENWQNLISVAHTTHELDVIPCFFHQRGIVLRQHDALLRLRDDAGSAAVEVRETHVRSPVHPGPPRRDLLVSSDSLRTWYVQHRVFSHLKHPIAQNHTIYEVCEC